MNAEADAVIRWLGLEKNRRWLMVFDNVDRDVQNDDDGQAYSVTSFLPAADHGSILITTRLPSLGEMGKSTEVTSLGLDQALELLSNRSGLHRSSSGKTRLLLEYYRTIKQHKLINLFADMNKLVQRLGNLPLALVQAGTYMHETKTGCSTYLDLYEKSWIQLAAETPRLRDYENGSIQTTWMISYNRIQHSNPTAGKLLQLWAYLDRQDVWYQLFLRGSVGCPECEWLQEMAQSEIEFKRVIRSLLAYSLIESHQDTESYSIHPVVHDWCSEMISDGNNDLITIALTIVGTAAPRGHSEPEYWLLQQRLLPHAERCLKQIDSFDLFNQLESFEASDAFHNLGLLYADRGKYTEAEKMYQRALDGYEGPNTLYTITNLGIVYRIQGNYIKAEKMYQRALDENEKLYGPDDPSTLDAVGNLGVLRRNQGKYTEAEKMYQRVLDGYEKARGPNHPSTLNTVHNLGALYCHQHRYTEADKMFQLALDRRTKALGPNHISTLNTVQNLGALYYDQGNYIEAEKMYQRALDGYKKELGPKHPRTIRIIKNIGNLYADPWSGSSKSSVSLGASETLVAGLDKITKFFLSDQELHNLFTEAFTRQNRDKFQRNGARLLKWFGRRLVESANTTVEKEAAEFFLSRRHIRSIMDRISLQIPETLTEEGRQEQIVQHRLQSSMNHERLETLSQQLVETPSVNVKPREPSALKSTPIFPDGFESGESIDSAVKQQIGGEEAKLNFDAAKSFLKSSDALARLKEELGDSVSPFRSEAMWKKTLWIGGQQVHFELPDAAPQITRVDKLKLALEEHLKMPMLWWPMTTPRKLLSSNKVRMILPCVS
ncbi:MAG: hypothetical protein Q9196_006743 [Gyalolechia fulgens]